MVIVKGDKRSESGALPPSDELAAMSKFNEELVRAGIMLAGEGLTPTSKAKRVRFPDKKVIDGPFAEAKECIAGYWVWQVKSIEEAVEWAKRAPCFTEGELELRPLFELTDFDMSNETRERFESQKARLQ
jgi:hypothetical protein